MSQRYSTLNQITPDNVKNLELQWMFQARSLENSRPRRWWWNGILYTVQRAITSWQLDGRDRACFLDLSLRPGAGRRVRAAVR